MKKIVEVKIKDGKVLTLKNIVHVADKNVVVVAGEFAPNFIPNLDGITLELISSNGSTIKTSSTTIEKSKFEILLDNELFKEKGKIQNTIRLIKNDKVFYINDSFNITVKDDTEIREPTENLTLVQILEALGNNSAQSNNKIDFNPYEYSNNFKNYQKNLERYITENLEKCTNLKGFAQLKSDYTDEVKDVPVTFFTKNNECFGILIPKSNLYTLEILKCDEKIFADNTFRKIFSFWFGEIDEDLLNISTVYCVTENNTVNCAKFKENFPNHYGETDVIPINKDFPLDDLNDVLSNLAEEKERIKIEEKEERINNFLNKLNLTKESAGL